MDSDLRTAVLTAARGRCLARAVPGCWRHAGSVHHRLTKGRGGRLLDAAGETYHLMPVCEPCHRHAHDSGQGHALGLLLRGEVRTRPDGRPLYTGPDPHLTALYGPDTELAP